MDAAFSSSPLVFEAGGYIRTEMNPQCAVAAGQVFLFVTQGFIVIIYVMDYRDIITIEPGKRSGKPCIRGLRMTVQDVLEYLASGMTEQEILDDFPDLTRDDILACLAFAADRERRLALLPQYEIAV